MASCLGRMGLNHRSHLFFSAHATICLLGVGLLPIRGVTEWWEWFHTLTFFLVLYHHLTFKINNCNECTKKDKSSTLKNRMIIIFSQQFGQTLFKLAFVTQALKYELWKIDLNKCQVLIGEIVTWDVVWNRIAWLLLWLSDSEMIKVRSFRTL